MGELTAAAAALAAARWLVYIASVLLIGQAGARLVCWRALGRHAPPDILESIDARQSALGLRAAVLLAAACLMLLVAQTFSWFGAAGFTDRSNIEILFTTGWGELWKKFASATVGIAIAAFVAWRWRRMRMATSLVVSLAVALATPLPGHGGSHGLYNWLYHATHLLGGGLWMGTLAVLLATTRPIWTGDDSAGLLKRLLASFSPLALTGAAMAIGTGTLLAVNHVIDLEFLVDTEFGRTVIVKSATVASAAALGFLNWRRFTPRAIDAPGRRTLWRVAAAEAILAIVLILGLTAWLTGQQAPDTFE